MPGYDFADDCSPVPSAPPNLPPVAQDVTYDIPNADIVAILSGTLVSSDQDPEQEPVSVNVTSPPAVGVWSVIVDSFCGFTGRVGPCQNIQWSVEVSDLESAGGTAQLTYDLCDPHGLCDEGTIAINAFAG
jgi:hypothetical protein